MCQDGDNACKDSTSVMGKSAREQVTVVSNTNYVGIQINWNMKILQGNVISGTDSVIATRQCTTLLTSYGAHKFLNAEAAQSNGL